MLCFVEETLERCLKAISINKIIRKKWSTAFLGISYINVIYFKSLDIKICQQKDCKQIT